MMFFAMFKWYTCGVLLCSMMYFNVLWCSQAAAKINVMLCDIFYNVLWCILWCSSIIHMMFYENWLTRKQNIRQLHLSKSINVTDFINKELLAPLYYCVIFASFESFRRMIRCTCALFHQAARVANVNEGDLFCTIGASYGIHVHKIISGTWMPSC